MEGSSSLGAKPGQELHLIVAVLGYFQDFPITNAVNLNSFGLMLCCATRTDLTVSLPIVILY